MIFVDSSAWFALAFEGDRHNDAARRLFVNAREIALATTDHVLVETWLLMNSRFGHNRAEQFCQRIRGLRLRLEKVTRDDLVAAWTIGSEFPDQTFSIVDRTSFVVMERLAVTRVISFDNDFVIYRYGPQKDRTFEVLR